MTITNYAGSKCIAELLAAIRKVGIPRFSLVLAMGHLPSLSLKNLFKKQIQLVLVIREPEGSDSSEITISARNHFSVPINTLLLDLWGRFRS